MEATDFDVAVTDDDVLSLIFKFVPPADLGTSVAWVSKRWHRVVMHGALHAPLPPALVSVLHDELEAGRLVRWKLHMALCFRNLLQDPHFAVNPKMYPANPFRECPWVWTKIGSVQTKFEVKPQGGDPVEQFLIAWRSCSPVDVAFQECSFFPFCCLQIGWSTLHLIFVVHPMHTCTHL